MALILVAGRYKRFESKQHAKAYFAKRRRERNNRTCTWAWRPEKSFSRF